MARTGRAEEWSWKARPRSNAALPTGDVGFESQLVVFHFVKQLKANDYEKEFIEMDAPE